jgi:hypothetical protein
MRFGGNENGFAVRGVALAFLAMLLSIYCNASGRTPQPLPSRSFTPSSAGLYVLAHSPAQRLAVELLVTDPSGKRTGVNPAAGTKFKEIPDGAYYAESIEDDIDPTTSEPTPEVKTFADSMPQSGKYVVDVFGTGEGPYTLDFLGYDAFGNVSTATVTGTASLGMMIRYQVLYSTKRGSPIQVVRSP